jgi:hypothetical protein
MGKLTNLNPSKALTESDLPSTMATDAEITNAINAHVNATDPHTQYPTQERGDLRYCSNDQGYKIKSVIFKGITSSDIGDISFPHGLNSKKIHSITGTIAATPEGEGGFPPGFIASTFGGMSEWHCFFTASRIFIVTGSSRANLINRRFTITVIYES